MWNHSKLVNQGYGAKNADTNSEATSNLWVGNLAMDVTETDLMILFQRHGAVDNVTLYSSRSYAFVSYKRSEDAMAAKDALQGTILRGQSIKIDFAKPARPSKSLWVGGIGPSVLREELEAQFLRFGKIEDLKFFRDRNTALVDYFRLEDASQALKVMNGAQIGDSQIRVDFLRSNPSRREHGRDAKEEQFFVKNMGPPLLDSPWMPPDSKRQPHSQHLRGPEMDEQPSNILCISYPPVIHIDEQMLHNAMILFGEIENIRSFPLRHCSFVEFRSVEEARRAKDGLQGKLFNDPRIVITYSTNDLTPKKVYPGFHINGPRPDIFPNEIPFRPPQMDPFNHNQSMLPNNFPPQLQIPMRPLLPNPEFDKFDKQQNPNHTLKRSGFLPSHSPALSPPVRPASGNWDAFESNQLQREYKRSRIDDPSFSFKQMDEDRRFGPLVDAADDLHSPHVNLAKKSHIVSPSDTRATSDGGLDYVWRGVIAKGGTPVCRARCVPIGEGIQSEIPEVVNCSARTGLDMLTKHYADAVGFDIIFFLPDSEEDFAPYTEFLRFLGAKNRAGVAKFDDGTTLFLVPPSDFLTKVLNVAGPERLYGVVLKFHQRLPGRSSAQSLSPPNRYIDNRPLPYPREERVLQPEDLDPHPRSQGLPSSESLPMYLGPPANTAPSSQPGLSLTPELIAALSSFLPPKEKSPASTTAPALSDRRLLQGLKNDHNTPEPRQVGSSYSQGWQNDHNAPDSTVHHPFNPQLPQLPAYQHLSQTPLTVGPDHMPHQAYDNISPTPRGDQSYEMPQQGYFQSRPLNNYASQSQVNQQYYHEQTRQDNPLGLYSPSNPDTSSSYNSTNNQLHGGNGSSQLHIVNNTVDNADKSNLEIPNQVQQQLQSALYGGVQSTSGPDKNERYKSTLQFAANLLLQVQQKQQAVQGTTHSGQGSGNH